jgi:UDP-N-acetyl-D-glucosamine dehydrogenase
MDERREWAAQQIMCRMDARRAVCGVIGLGFIGSTLMDAIVNAGYQVHGSDRSDEAVNRFRGWMEERNPDAGGRWSAGCDTAALSEAEVVMVAVRTPPRGDGSVELEPLEAVTGILRPHRLEPRLILLESTVPCGTTRCFAASLRARPGIFVAHSPERLSVGHDRRVLRSVPHLVGGIDADAGRVGAHFLRMLCDRVVAVSSPEVSELSKLVENAFLTMGIALSNEVTQIAHMMGVAAEEVCAAAATKPFGYYPFYPGPGLGGHCLGNDLEILISTSKRLGVPSALMNAVAAAATNGPVLVLRRLEGLLRERGLELQNRRILLVGVGFKPGTSDTTESPAREVVRLLRDRGADVWYLDSLVREFAVDGQAIKRMQAGEAANANFTATLILAGDCTAPVDRLVASSELVLDARGKSLEGRPDGVQTL